MADIWNVEEQHENRILVRCAVEYSSRCTGPGILSGKVCSSVTRSSVRANPCWTPG